MNMFVCSESKFLVVLVYVGQMLATLFRIIYWFVFKRSSRIAQLAYQLEQLNVEDRKWCDRLAKLNEQYLSQSIQIQQQRRSIDLERTKILEQLKQCSQSESDIKSVPVIKCDSITPLDVKNIITNRSFTTKPEKVNRSNSMEQIIKQFDRPKPVVNLTVARQTSISKSRSVSPISFGNKQMTNEIAEKQRRPLSAVPIVQIHAELPKKEINIIETVERKIIVPKNQSKINNDNNVMVQEDDKISTNRMNESINQVMENVIKEFKSCDNDKESCKKNQKFRESIKELYSDPEWRPFINDLKKQYKIFYYLN